MAPTLTPEVRAALARAGAELLALVAPPACLACRRALGAGARALCPECLRALPWIGARGCPRCGLPSHRRAGCPAAHAAFDRAWAPVAYDGAARALVIALKRRGALPAADVMAAQMAASLPRDVRAVDRAAVVPVPAQRARQRRRGYDPAGAIAAAFARRLGVPLVPCLRRRDRGGRQVGVGRAGRRRADRLALAVVAAPPATVLLVDDVHTTGATLDACAHALRAAGARTVVALSYARTL